MSQAGDERRQLSGKIVQLAIIPIAAFCGVFLLARAGLGLEPTDFRLRKITDFYDMGQVDTMSRMRETATEASFRGRELDQGLEE